jgi:N-acetylglutamate synthase-like GNAT family acetyltransferase
MEVTRDGAGTVRSATVADAAGLARLCASLGIDVLPLGIADVAACLDRGHLIVLDLGAGMIDAAAHVALSRAGEDGVHARIEVAIHPALAGSGAEDRLAAALLAICEASGDIDLDVATRRRNTLGGR